MISIIIIDNKIEKDGAAMYKIYSMEDGYLKETDELKEDIKKYIEKLIHKLDKK